MVYIFIFVLIRRPPRSTPLFSSAASVVYKGQFLELVSSLFSRRGYNIDSLAVGPTENPNFSRMTIVINVEDHALEQVIAQLDKLINVITITELDPVTSVQRLSLIPI